jgi:hypothetical protein
VQPVVIEFRELGTTHVHRFNADHEFSCEFSCESWPKRLTLSLFQHHRITTRDNVAAVNINDDGFQRDTQRTNDMLTPPPSPMAVGDDFESFAMMSTAVPSPLGRTYSSIALGLARRQAFWVPDMDGSFHADPL